MIYIKFRTDEVVTNSGQQTEGWLSRAVKTSLTNIMGSIIPKANPDFDAKISHVKEWILEVEDEEGTPNREIGLDDKGTVMMIMPWRNNYGFWTDSPVRVEDLARSNEITFGTKKEFDALWEAFEHGGTKD